MDSQPAELTALAGPPHGLKQLGLVRTLGLGLLVVALWMATRPYQGIIEDSRFYTVEALNGLLPGRFSQDLYFQFGSQGRFTIFSLLYKPLISFFGLAGGNIALTILAQCLWLGGLCYLSHVLFRDWKLASLAVMGAILLPGGMPLHYGELFVTPRSFAEALTFWALGSQLKERPFRALALLGVSLLIHPLMTLPGLAVWFLYQASQWRILWLFAATATVALFGLALAGIQPFSWLLLRFDPAWFAIIRQREDFCFVTLWQLTWWLSFIGSVALGFFEFILATPPERRLLAPVFAVGVGGMLVSLIGGDLLHNVLLFDIQTWRFMWIFTLIANLFAVKMFLRAISAKSITSWMSHSLVGLALGSMVVSQFFLLASMGGSMLMVLGAFACCWEWTTKKPLPMLGRIPLALAAGCALAVLGTGMQLITDGGDVRPSVFGDPLHQLLLSLSISVAIGLLLYPPEYLTRKKLHPSLVFVAALGLAVIACWHWDQRTPWNRFIDASNPPSDLAALLPGKTPIYWEGDVATPWFLLKRASYFSCDQGTGALFSRGTAIAYDARFKNFEKLQTLDFRQYSFCPLTDARRTTPLRRTDLSTLCAKEPGLGALILTERAVDAPYRTWISPVPYESLEASAGGGWKAFSADRFHIYQCADLR